MKASSSWWAVLVEGVLHRCRIFPATLCCLVAVSKVKNFSSLIDKSQLHVA